MVIGGREGSCEWSQGGGGVLWAVPGERGDLTSGARGVGRGLTSGPREWGGGLMSGPRGVLWVVSVPEPHTIDFQPLPLKFEHSSTDPKH